MINDAFNEKENKIDRLQLLALAGLMFIGLAFVYSATMASPFEAQKSWIAQTWFKQVIWYGLGLSAAGAVCMVSYHTLARWSFVFYWLMIVCLVAVLVPHIGSMRYGARRWIDLGFFQFQPSEFAKLAFILALANFLSRPLDELRRWSVFWQAMGLMVLPFLLILKEPDLGSALVLMPTGLAMMLVAGVPKKYIFRIVSGVGLIAALFVVDIVFLPNGRWQVPMQDYQRNRLLIYFGRNYTDFASPDATQAELERLRQKQVDDGYNIRQALISVGSGGPFGKGWRRGTQNALGYLPRAVAHNDFIFSVIAEEEGFVGSVIVITLYGVVLFTGLRTAGQARDRLGKLVAVGAVMLIFSHVFVNIGMNIRIMPVTGVPLPLLSYGGSSVLCSLIALGLMQNVYMNRRGY